MNASSTEELHETVGAKFERIFIHERSTKVQLKKTVMSVEKLFKGYLPYPSDEALLEVGKSPAKRGSTSTRFPYTYPRKVSKCRATELARKIWNIEPSAERAPYRIR